MVKKRRLLKGSYNNIINVYNNASDELKTEGNTWYQEAHILARNVGQLALPRPYNNRVRDLANYGDIVSSRYEYRQDLLGAGIIAVFSPQMVWEKNIRAANVFAGSFDKPVWITNRDYDKAIKMVKCVRENINVEAEDILEILGDGAVKTRPFFMNILNPDGDVKYNGSTIDRHAIAIYLGDVPSPLQVGRASSKNGNTQIQNSYTIASKRLGVHHNAVQATTWLEWRINKEDYLK